MIHILFIAPIPSLSSSFRKLQLAILPEMGRAFYFGIVSTMNITGMGTGVIRW